MRCLRLLSTLSLVAIAATAISCASSKTDVDVTPTGRFSVDAHVGKGWSSDSSKIENISSSFRPEDVVHAVVDLSGDQAGTITARWLTDAGAVVSETSRTIEAGRRNYPFWLSNGTPLANGDYRLEVWVNGKLEDTEKFKIST